jgi:hypothetical protein
MGSIGRGAISPAAMASCKPSLTSRRQYLDWISRICSHPKTDGASSSVIRCTPGSSCASSSARHPAENPFHGSRSRW